LIINDQHILFSVQNTLPPGRNVGLLALLSMLFASQDYVPQYVACLTMHPAEKPLQSPTVENPWCPGEIIDSAIIASEYYFV
jgi:hypothetical protein